jgi:predicted O-methyltransferase YrrM
MIIPAIFRDVPRRLMAADPPATSAELEAARGVRRRFLVRGEAEPYMHDVVRAMRLVAGARRYAEIGTRDRGCIAYVAPLLGFDPVIVDVDLVPMPECEARIAEELAGRARYTLIHGDSGSGEVASRVAEALGPAGADAIFCDSSHMYLHTLTEFERYWPLVRPGGLLMYHDALWEGNATDKGKYHALAQIDRFVPVYVVVEAHPVHRLLPHSSKGDVWGAVAIIPKPGIDDD